MTVIWLIGSLLVLTVGLVKSAPATRLQEGASIVVSKHKSVSLGSTVTLHCKAKVSGVPISEVVWSEGGVAISDLNGHTVINNTNLFESELVIFNISYSDLGEYTCSMSVDVGTKISSSTMLRLADQNSNPSIEKVKLHHSENHIVSCGSSEKLHYKDLTTGRSSSGKHTEELRIKMNSLSKQSKVVCVSSEGTVSKISYVLADYEPITFVTPRAEKSWRSVPDFSPVTLNCSVTGSPTPQLEWVYRGHTLTNQDGHIELTRKTNSLSLHFVLYSQLFDRGWYGCRASNVWESNTHEVHLPGQQPVALSTDSPNFYSIVEFAGPDNPMVGDNIHLKCTVNVDPIVKIYGMIVRKNGGELRGTLTRDVRSNNTHVYTRSINNVDQSDGGTYECVIFSLKFLIQVKKELSLVVTNK